MVFILWQVTSWTLLCATQLTPAPWRGNYPADREDDRRILLSMYTVCMVWWSTVYIHRISYTMWCTRSFPHWLNVSNESLSPTLPLPLSTPPIHTHTSQLCPTSDSDGHWQLRTWWQGQRAVRGNPNEINITHTLFTQGDGQGNLSCWRVHI